MGSTNSGKSSVINCICKREVCKVSVDETAGTMVFQRVPVPELNAIFYDTI
jgi:ribosome biogenesis GTPase A